MYTPQPYDVKPTTRDQLFDVLAKSGARGNITARLDRAEVLSCGHLSLPPDPSIGGAAGYATTRDDQKICYSCADDREREALKTQDQMFAYLSDRTDNTEPQAPGSETQHTNGHRLITTWTGGFLMRVTSIVWRRVGFPDVTGRRPMRAYLHATDVHGQKWVGTSPGSGMYARMRRAKRG